MDNNENKKFTFFSKNFIFLISAFTTIASFITAVIKLFENFEIGINYITDHVIYIAMILILAIVMWALKNTQKYDGEISKLEYIDFIETNSNISHDLLHKIRDIIFSLENRYIDKNYSNCIDFEKSATEDIINLLDGISIKISKTFNKEVRVCIKCLNYTSNGEKDFRKMNLMTFARSGKDVHSMLAEHKNWIKLNENTDFLNIVDRGPHEDKQLQYFYSENLQEYALQIKNYGIEYRNSNKDWKEQYNTTLVCPIRLKTHRKGTDEYITEYNLIGFLCIDAKEAETFESYSKEIVFDLLFGMSDIIYVYMEKFIKYYNIIKKEENDNKSNDIVRANSNGYNIKKEDSKIS